MIRTGTVSAVDIYCGIGGLAHGMVKEGINVVAGIDIDSSCKYPFEKNNNAKFISKDIAAVSSDELAWLYPEGDWKVLAGCAPCTPFSRYSRKVSTGKWRLLRDFGRLVRGVRPEIVTMENVPRCEEHPVFIEFVDLLGQEGYHVEWGIVDCRYYGIPQKRKRLVLLASKLAKIGLLPKTHYPGRQRTVEDAIKGLEPLLAGEASENDPIHRARSLSDLNMERMRQTPPGGGWRDWDEELRLDCHKKESGKTYRDVYGRMCWDEPAPTMTTHCTGWGNGRFGHPEQDRAISIREAALIQTFPKSYQFVPPGEAVPVKRLSKHLGNAVPVRLGRIIGRSIIRHVDRYVERQATPIDD